MKPRCRFCGRRLLFLSLETDERQVLPRDGYWYAPWARKQRLQNPFSRAVSKMDPTDWCDSPDADDWPYADHKPEPALVAYVREELKR